MGNKGSCPRSLSRQEDASTIASESTCTCSVKRTLTVEKHRTPLTERTRRAAQDFLFSLSYYRKQPRSLIGKLNFGLYLATFEVCPKFCCPPFPSSIVHKLAFQPPPKPTYKLVPFGRTDLGEIDYRLELKPASSVFLRYLYRRCVAYPAQFRCMYLGDVSSSDRIACCFVRSISPQPSSRPFTLLYSHSNGMDIGYCAGYLAFLARRLRVDIFCWDYPGYGRSGGECSENRLYNAIERVYEFLTITMKIPWEQIVAVGTSLGTAASIHLVATAGRPVQGIILQGGFMSALRVLCPNRRRTSGFDQFVNIDKIKTIQIPTLVIHGCKDGLFNITHARTLQKACPGAAKIRPLFIKEGLHVDFEDYLAYWRRLHTFLHAELVPASENDQPCCTYHPAELKRREPNIVKATSTRSLSIEGNSTPRIAPPKPVIVCEHCLKLDKVSQSTYAMNLKSGRDGTSGRETTSRRDWCPIKITQPCKIKSKN